MQNRLPEKLMLLRKHYQYAQKTVADKTGIPLMTYMSYENGASIPDYETLRCLAKFFHVSFEELFVQDMNISLRNHAVSAEEKMRKEIKKEQYLSLLHKYKYYLAGGLALLLFIAFLFINRPEETPFVMKEPSLKERFDASAVSVVYVDEQGFVNGSGDNSNGQLNVQGNYVAVAEGATFTLALDNQGKIHSFGLLEKVANEVSSWQRIVSMDAGDGHILALDDEGSVYCAGDNNFGQCDYQTDDRVHAIYALPKGSVLVLQNGSVVTAGEFVGSSQLKKMKNLIAIDASDNNLIYLSSNGTAGYFSKNKDYPQSGTWNDLIDVRCGNDFLAGLKSDGTVVIAIDNYLIEDVVSSWKGIIAIASGDDYLVAFDGNMVYGVGKNAYGQFHNDSAISNNLPTVKNVKVEIGEEKVKISFDPLINASAYLISIDAGTGISAKITEPVYEIPLSSFEENKTYLLHIIALGEGIYENSETLSLEFQYIKETQKPSETEGPGSGVIEVPFSLLKLTGMSKTNFEAYLSGLGVNGEQLVGSESENPCSGNEATVETVSGITDYEMITTSDLLARKIHYTYCHLAPATEEPANGD